MDEKRLFHRVLFDHTECCWFRKELRDALDGVKLVKITLRVMYAPMWRDFPEKAYKDAKKIEAVVPAEEAVGYIWLLSPFIKGHITKNFCVCYDIVAL